MVCINCPLRASNHTDLSVFLRKNAIYFENAAYGCTIKTPAPLAPIFMNVVYYRITQYGKSTKNTQIVSATVYTEKVGERLEALPSDTANIIIT